MPTLYFNSTRYAKLPLHYGHAPDWLIERMRVWGGAMVEAIILQHGQSGFLSRLSDAFWFQIFGTVLGMDWHSSGITTTVMGTLKPAVNQRFKELGIYICGGRGKYSRQTPDELMVFAERTGLNGTELVRASRLSAKVDNTAIHDGSQIYMHSFIVTDKGEWGVVQQGMDDHTGMARRYHWHSANLKSFVEDPHTGVYGQSQGKILNLTAPEAKDVRDRILAIVKDSKRILPEIQKILTASGHVIPAKEVNAKWISNFTELVSDKEFVDFESLLLLEGIGPKAIHLLALASNAMYGTALQFTDPAHFPFAHGGKNDPSSLISSKEYEETVRSMEALLEKAKIENADKQIAFQNLSQIKHYLEHGFERVQINSEQRKESIEAAGESSLQKGSGQLGLFPN